MSSSATEDAPATDATSDDPGSGSGSAAEISSAQDTGRVPGDAPADEDEAIAGEADGDDYLAHDNEAYDEPYRRPKVSKLAVVALITGILPLVPVAVGTGIAALAGIRRSGRRGHGMAVSALFLAAAWVIIGGAFGTVDILTHGFHKPTKIVYHQSGVFSLRTGQCVDSPDATSPTVVPCAGPHDAEVFGTFTMPAGPWAGAAAVQQQASSQCGELLTGYLNPQLAITLSQSYVYPDQVDWNAGTRTVICEVRAASGQLTQSVRGGAAGNS